MEHQVLVVRYCPNTQPFQSTFSCLRPQTCKTLPDQHSYLAVGRHCIMCVCCSVHPVSTLYHSKVAENRTYCEFSVQFLIRIHGFGMSTLTTVFALSVSYDLYIMIIHHLISLWLILSC